MHLNYDAGGYLKRLIDAHYAKIRHAFIDCKIILQNTGDFSVLISTPLKFP